MYIDLLLIFYSIYNFIYMEYLCNLFMYYYIIWINILSICIYTHIDKILPLLSFDSYDNEKVDIKCSKS